MSGRRPGPAGLALDRPRLGDDAAFRRLGLALVIGFCGRVLGATVFRAPGLFALSGIGVRVVVLRYAVFRGLENHRRSALGLLAYYECRDPVLGRAYTLERLAYRGLGLDELALRLGDRAEGVGQDSVGLQKGL